MPVYGANEPNLGKNVANTLSNFHIANPLFSVTPYKQCAFETSTTIASSRGHCGTRPLSHAILSIMLPAFLGPILDTHVMLTETEVNVS